MTFTENKTRRLTGQKAMSFVLRNVVVKNLDADVFFGFSGEGKTLQFGFKKGKIYDPDGNYVHSYSPQEAFIVSGDFSKDYYNYSINEESIARGISKDDFKVEKWFVTGDWANSCTFSSAISIYSDPVGYSITIPEVINQGDTFSITTENTSTDAEIYIFGVSLKNSSATKFNVDSFSNLVPPLTSSSISVLNTAGAQGYHEFEIDLDTNVGKITKTSNIKILEPDTPGVLSAFLEVTENALDQFTYEEGTIDNEGLAYFEYYTAISGGSQGQAVTPTLEWVSGDVGVYYRVAGVEITDSGKGYTGSASVEFSAGQAGDAQAAGGVVMDNDEVSGVNVTYSGAYFASAPTLSFSGDLDPNDSTSRHAAGNAILETYEKTFSNSWDIHTGLALTSVSSYGENGLTGLHGENTYPLAPTRPGIYEPIAPYTLSSEQKLFIKITGKSFYDFSLMTAKLKVTGSLADSNSDRYFEEFLITGGNKE